MFKVLCMTLPTVLTLNCYKYHHISSSSEVGTGVTSFYTRTEECAEGVKRCLKWRGMYHLSEFYFDFTRPYFDGGCGPVETENFATSDKSILSLSCPLTEDDSILSSPVTACDSHDSCVSFPLSAVSPSLTPYPFEASDSWLAIADCKSRTVAYCVETGKVEVTPMACGREGYRPVRYEIFSCESDLCNSGFSSSLFWVGVVLLLGGV